MDARAFLEEMFGDAVAEGSELVLFSLPPESTWHTGIDDAVRHLTERGRETDVYFGCSLQNHADALAEHARRNGGNGAHSVGMMRGYAATAAAIGGLWLDLDVGSDGHTKKNLPPNRDAARKILAALPAAPSVLLDTGGGFHAWWLFEEPLILATDEQRSRAALLSLGWQTLAKHIASKDGYVIDSTADLARVMRMPGTTSHKQGRVVVCETDNGPRWNPDNFDAWIPDDLSATDLRPVLRATNFTLNQDANPSIEKHQAMMSMDAKFKATWLRKRADLPSQSEHDMSLASLAMHAGWKDQEIVDLVIAHRRSGSGKPKLRVDYYEALLRRARSGISEGETHERISDRIESVRADGAVAAAYADAADTTGGKGGNAVHMNGRSRSAAEKAREEQRPAFLADVSAMIGMPVQAIIRFPGDPPSYRLVLAEGSIDLGGVETITNQAAFRNRVAAASGHLIARFKGPLWDPIAQALLLAVEEQSLGIDDEPADVAREWVEVFLSKTTVYAVEDRHDAIAARKPWSDSFGVSLFLVDLRRFVTIRCAEPGVTRRSLARLLRMLGAEPKTVGAVKPNGARTTAKIWRIPHAALGWAYGEESPTTPEAAE